MLPEMDGFPRIRDDEFALFQTLIRREAGIFLGRHKRPLLVSRLLPRLRALELQTFSEYYRHVLREGRELEQMINCICTNETHFFREPAQFDHLRRAVIPALRQRGPRPLRVWSAACSTGEEPYSLAMMLHAELPGFPVEIVATDLSTRALARARAGVFPIERAAEIPEAYLHAFMLRGQGPEQGKMKAAPEIRALLRVHRHNLLDEARPALGLFDLIFCRNVLIYFDAETRAAVAARLLECLRPDGALFLGHAEGLGFLKNKVEAIMPTVYRLR